MSLVSSMFSANGRLAPADFQSASLILIAVSFVIAASAMFLPIGIYLTLAFISIILVYPWACLWSKRLHDAGQSGWLFLVVLVVWMIIGWIANTIIGAVLGGDAAMQMQAASESGDPAAIFQAMEGSTRGVALPTAIVNAIVSFLFVFVSNMILKSDPEENRYGLPTGAPAAAEPDAE